MAKATGGLVDSAGTRAWLRAAAALFDREQERLTRLDRAIGDGDHGVNMRRGFRAAVAALGREGSGTETAGQVLYRAGAILTETVGGAAGPLFGGSFRALGGALDEGGDEGGDGDEYGAGGVGGAPGSAVAGGRRLAAALGAACDSIREMGATRTGDKTLYDVYRPATDAFTRAVEGGGTPVDWARAAAGTAEDAARATAPIQARRGRASYLGLRSVGHQDPGAASAALIFRALVTALEGK
ncbi:DAK2 domain-containing protein [Streptomyces sp. NPDC046887]|uniref:DAK2 domain-containing protein n=1 Tax=Streptomyces sp. NPDC046887 TaxID=3155472 RepID=UPI0033DB9114